ncbi:MAG: hypothetical protein JWN49_398, partial [Parcubacteria group bacterium]|nr:hypothetical protein [Parcubacteria group bacterium]
MSYVTHLTAKNRFLLAALAFTACVLASTLYFNAQYANACNGNDSYVGSDNPGSCTDVDNSQSDPAQVVFTANPATIQQGSSSLLSWGPDNSGHSYPYESCTIDHGVGTFSTTGSVTVAPSTTTTYNIECLQHTQYSVLCGNTNCFVNGVRGTNAEVTVTVTQNPALLVSCSVNPTALSANGTAAWSVTASGGTGSYTYAWSGTDGLSGSGTSVSKQYTTAGTKTGTVTVTSLGTQGFNTLRPEVHDSGLLADIRDAVASLIKPIQTAHAMMISCDGGGFAFFMSGGGGGCNGGGVDGGGGATANTVSCTNTLDVTNLTSPDLTPLSLTPHTVVAGTQSTFTATLHNGGTAPTPTFSSTVYV